MLQSICGCAVLFSTLFCAGTAFAQQQTVTNQASSHCDANGSQPALCACKCGCQAPCKCGCAEGHACTCHQH